MKASGHTLLIAVFLLILLGLSPQAQADLYNRGTDSLGNRLIYDSDLDLTWYDYTEGINTWDNVNSWASSLSVDFGGTVYDDWMLPTKTSFSRGIDGDMKQLYFTGLGNTGSGLENTGPFVNLQGVNYWEDTYFDGGSWYFDMRYGTEDFDGGPWGDIYSAYGLAVRNGDVGVVPEPISSILFVTGGTLFAARTVRKRGRSEVRS